MDIDSFICCIEGLAQDRSSPIANALESLQSRYMRQNNRRVKFCFGPTLIPRRHISIMDS